MTILMAIRLRRIILSAMSSIAAVAASAVQHRNDHYTTIGTHSRGHLDGAEYRSR